MGRWILLLLGVSVTTALSCSRLPCQGADPSCEPASAAVLLFALPGSLGGSALGIVRTGQSLCYDTAGTSAACPLATHPLQDGEVLLGRFRNSVGTSDGHIFDQATGLIWRRCTLGYSGRNCEFVGPQTSFTIADANIECSNLGEGWRLPTIQELSTLMDSGRSNPSYNPALFPDGNFGIAHWSATADAGTPGSSFRLDFSLGVIISDADTNTNGVRCVRGPVHSGRHTYSAAGENSVLDTVTGLTWQKCANGQTIPNCTGAITIQGWQAALQYCRDLTLDGKSWRLPNRNELQSLMDYTVTAPRINQQAFPNASTGNFWTSSTVHGSSSQAWTIDFSTGIAAPNGKGGTGPGARCVSGP